MAADMTHCRVGPVDRFLEAGFRRADFNVLVFVQMWFWDTHPAQLMSKAVGELGGGLSCGRVVRER